MVFHIYHINDWAILTQMMSVIIDKYKYFQTLNESTLNFIIQVKMTDFTMWTHIGRKNF